MIAVFFVNAGKIPEAQSAMNALTEWANFAERRLQHLSCGYVLPRERHRAWAQRMMQEAIILRWRSEEMNRELTFVVTTS